ncbi:MAG: hypothetical protein HY560_07590 [Gemmatimonadetes bacterium]|nr:hypothetical protein [Gemmatimonadota bacterium]
MSHIPLGRVFTVGDIEIEQELSRPYVYVPRLHGTTSSAGFNIISVKDPARAKVLYYWRIENPELHQGIGALQNKYFKLKGRYYDAQSVQFAQGGPNADLGAVVLDVTGLPDTATIREVGRVRAPETPGGFHNIFAYKHSDGRALMFATVQAPHANVYDMERFLAGDSKQGLVGTVPIPPQPNQPLRGYHDFYVGYDPATHQDRFYGAGAGGYYVYDVTNTAEPKLLVSIAGVAGITGGHTFTPTPDGRYAVAETEYQYAPLRIFDMKPALDGQVKTISRPIGAWISDWTTNPHNHEVRWPYVFVSAYEEGLQVFNMMDPANPYTVGYYDTYDGPHRMGRAPSGNPEQRWLDPTYPIPPVSEVVNGAFGVDVRNADGLIVISDMTTGFWAFKLDGFDGWNGRQWGMPNISSAQDWDNGPEGAGAAQRVSE